MSDLSPDSIAHVFLLFCRIGSCLMLMPGFSSSRVPANVRLFLAVGVTLALAPALLPLARAAAPEVRSTGFFVAIAAECLVGGLIGIVSRMFFFGLETMMSVAAMSLGLSANLGVPIEGEESIPVLADLLTMAATALLFATDLHWEIIRGLFDSYDVIPIATLNSRLSLVRVVDATSASFLVCLRIASPFIIFGLLINLAFGLLNKMVQQVPIYFVAVPFTAAGGIGLLYLYGGESLALFMRALSAWLRMR